MFYVGMITTSSQQEAEMIAQKLLDERMIACCNIVSPIQSLFHWQGKVQSETEALMVIKTHQHHWQALIKRVKELHSYSVPEIIAMPIVEGNEDYLNWCQESMGIDKGSDTNRNQ